MVHVCACELVKILLGRDVVCNMHGLLIDLIHTNLRLFSRLLLLCAAECAGIRSSREAFRVYCPAHALLLA